MEFEEMKKVWDAQNNEPIYGINEKALHNQILSKKKQAHHTTNLSELFSIIAYTLSGCFIIAINLMNKSNNIFMYSLSAWILCMAMYSLVSRVRRRNGLQQFDRSMHGDLEHAISMATYQVKYSRLVRWNILPVGLLILLAIWDTGKSTWLLVGTSIFLVLANYASGWEHNYYKKKKRELEKLKEKLDSVDQVSPATE